jgi:hypothetical protein
MGPGFLDEGTKVSLVPRGPTKYPSSGGRDRVQLHDTWLHERGKATGQ